MLYRILPARPRHLCPAQEQELEPGLLVGQY